jgi:hypothetical protein
MKPCDQYILCHCCFEPPLSGPVGGYGLARLANQPACFWHISAGCVQMHGLYVG